MMILWFLLGCAIAIGWRLVPDIYIPIPLYSGNFIHIKHAIITLASVVYFGVMFWSLR